jgi:hypothetical protein
MATPFSLPETLKPVSGIACQTTNGGVVSDWVKMTDSNRIHAIVILDQAAANATAVSIQQATDADGTGAKVLTNECRIWANEDTATSDTLVRQTDAKNYTVTADIAEKMIVFAVEPTHLDVANDFDWIKVVIADSQEATNFAAVVFVMDKKTRAATPPTDIA